MKRRVMIQLGAAAVMASLGAARAATHQPFDAKTFEAAQSQGLPILVHVTASWCPVCKAQKPIVEDLGKASSFARLIVFDVDFDTQTDALRLFNAQSQSTLIAFHGTTETGRSVGDTDPDAIAAVMTSALGK